jgi:hypothetical protein
LEERERERESERDSRTFQQDSTGALWSNPLSLSACLSSLSLLTLAFLALLF